MRRFTYREEDPEGQETLEVIAAADNFNRWVYETVRPFCSGRILEAGSGIGNISACLLQAHEEVILSDVRHSYCDALRQRFSGAKACAGIVCLDLVHPRFDTVYAHLLATFDTVIALNVVEHIADDHQAVGNAAKLLRAGGRLVVLVPAYPFLYNRFDRELAHFRRYTLPSLTRLVAAHLSPVHGQYFNLCGIPGWFLSGRILQKKTIPAGQMRLFDRLVPVFKIVDKLLGYRAGLSVMVVGQRLPANK